MKRFPIALAVAAVTLWNASAVFAQGVEVNGLALQTTNATNNLNAAIGVNSKARQAFGVINGDTEINGLALQTTNATNNLNAAIGVGSEACQTAGVIGDVGDACGDE
jgi:hypothetical protein